MRNVKMLAASAAALALAVWVQGSLGAIFGQIGLAEMALFAAVTMTGGGVFEELARYMVYRVWGINGADSFSMVIGTIEAVGGGTMMFSQYPIPGIIVLMASMKLVQHLLLGRVMVRLGLKKSILTHSTMNAIVCLGIISCPEAGPVLVLMWLLILVPMLIFVETRIKEILV